MFQDKIFEPIGCVVAIATLFFSLFLFYHYTDVFWGSLAAACMAAAWAWATYIILRMILLAIRR